MKSSSKASKHIHRVVAYALFAGVIAAPFAAPHAYALPIEGANAAANKTEADISTSGAVMDITGKTAHNILKWEDFSIDSGEKVRFDGGSQTRDYLNLVTGEGASNIYGTIEGGRNVYLVNPHGILFAKGSQVNTGALYLSTANPADIAAATSTFKTNGTSPLSASAQMGDVLNLGTVKASKLYIEGKNVKVLNTDAVTDANGTALTGSAVTIRSEETPHIGYDVANTTTRNFTVNGATVSKTVSDYASTNVAHHAASAKSRGWDVKKLNGTDAHTDYDYMRVHNVYELQNMDANRIDPDPGDPTKRRTIGRYMLANDIAASETKDWTGGFQPIGDASTIFRGQFDGAGHTITGLTIKPPTDDAGRYSRGMFGYTKQAVIENVSLKDASVSGTQQVGGIVGAAEEGSVIRNVSFSGKVQGPGTGNTAGTSIGGIVGKLKQSTLENAYHEGTVEGNSFVGGIVGFAYQQDTIQNVRNAGKVVGNQNIGGIVGAVQYDTNIRNALQTGIVEQRSGQGDSSVGGVVGLLDDESKVTHAVWKEGSVKDGNGAPIENGVGKVSGNSTATDVEKRSEAQMKLAETYKDWKDGSGKALVATEGGKGTPWRIYDGKTMPLLTAFLRTKHLANREKVYDGTAPTIAGGDHISLDAEKNVGTYHAYSEQYDIIGGAYKITPKELTLSFTSYARFNKTYDGSDTATRTLTQGLHYRLTGFVGSEGSDVELADDVTGKYADKNAGKDKEVTFQNLALTGTGAKNYTIKKAQGVGTITPKELTLDLVGSTRFDKTYDGNANVTQSLAKGTNYTLTGFVGSEGTGITVTGTGSYANKNAAADKAVTFDGLTLTGTGAGNYTLNKTTLTGTGTIARRALTLGAVAGQTKTYDGTTDADAAKFGAVLNNVVAGEENLVKATASGATYNSKDVATAGTVGYTGVALTGTGAGNYTLAATTAQGAGTITRRALTVDTVAAQSKTYDGTTAADTSKFQATLGNFVAGEEGSVAATATGATYNDKNVAAANKVSYTGLALTGTGAGNYTVANTAEGAGAITPKELNLALAGGARFDKTYDGTANVTQALAKGGNYTLTGFVGTEGDHLALAAATGTYTAGKDAGTDKEVTFKNLTLTGTGAGNYTLDTNALTGIGTIARRALTLGAVAAQTKTYDGTTAADASQFHAALGNVVAGDDVTAAAAGASYNDKNVAGANAVGYTGLALRGAAADNYSLAATTAQGAGSITKRTLTASAVAAQTKTYDGTTAADASQFRATLDNVVTGEENSVTATAAGAAYNDKNVAGANAVSYTGVALTGTGAANYAIADTAQGAGTITQRALTLGAVESQTKTYDGTRAADASQFRAALAGAIAGDNVTAAAAGAAYNDKNVAAANRIDYTGVALAGADAGNYSLAATTAQGAGTITRRTLTVDTVAAQTKTYDGTRAADAAQFRAALAGAVAGDSVTAAATGATYNNKNVAGASTVGYTGVALRGADAGNYSLAATTAQGAGTITRRALTLGAVAAQTKTYDGSVSADAGKFSATLGNTIAGDSVTATAADAAYNSKDVAAANAVNYTGVALGGSDAGNYTLAATTAQGTGTITKRALTLGAVESQTKTYDGTRAADAAQFRAALSGIVAGDSVTAAATGATYNNKNVAGASTVGYTGVALRGADAANYSLAATTAQGAGSITHRTLTLTAAPQSVVQGEALPSFTGRADGFADGEDASVFGADGIAFGTAAANTDTPGSYDITGRIGSITGGVLGNYRIMQAAGNATAFTVHAALPSGILAALVQDAAPRFDTGFDQEVYVFGLPRPIPAATLGFYRFTPARDLGIEGLRLD